MATSIICICKVLDCRYLFRPFAVCKHTQVYRVHCYSSSQLQPNRALATKRQYLSNIYLQHEQLLPENPVLSCKSHKLFVYNNIISMCHPGVFHLFPAGVRALEKLTSLIDEELQAIGGQKICMPTLAPQKLWEKSGRWELAGKELFRLKDRNGHSLCLGPTHEELVTNIVSNLSALTYKRLPLLLYQITRKYRDEMVPKFGLLRGREFEMKDLYTFDRSLTDAQNTYSLVCQTYNRIFDRLKLDFVSVAGSTGNIGGQMSHEYHLPADIGEDTLYICNTCGYGTNSELIEADKSEVDITCKQSGCHATMCKTKGIEVGHAFLLGTKYSKQLGATYADSDGKHQLTEMGCYGLGVSRILQASVEVLSPEDQIRWPSLIAPYQVLIIPQKQGYLSEKLVEISDSLSDRIQSMQNLRGEVVIDDRLKLTVGRRMHSAKAAGYPYIVVVNSKAVEDPGLLEVVDLYRNETELLTEDQLCDKLSEVETL